MTGRMYGRGCSRWPATPIIPTAAGQSTLPRWKMPKPPPADTPDIAQLLVDQDAAFTVHQCLHTLDEPYKEVFSLRVFGELPFERIGLIFGHNAAWARVTYYRAKTQLQKMLSTST